MKIWRVIINWRYAGLSFMSERGVRCDSAGQALDAALASVRADRAEDWRATVEQAVKLDAFSHEASLLPVVYGTGETVRDCFP